MRPPIFRIVFPNNGQAGRRDNTVSIESDVRQEPRFQLPKDSCVIRQILLVSTTAIGSSVLAWCVLATAAPGYPLVRDACSVFVCVVLLGKGLYDTLFYDHFRP